MMIYDYVFVTHLPAFYKVNLYNELSKTLNIFVIFVSSGSEIRTPDFVGKTPNFKYCVLNKGDFEKRNMLTSLLKLFCCIRALSYRNIVLGGWDLYEYWALALFTPKKKLCLVLESTVDSSKTGGLRGLVKKYFVSRVVKIFASGKQHEHLARTLGFRGVTYITQGVGLINKTSIKRSKREFSGKFLYVGRLSKEKNLELLIAAFYSFPHLDLTIIGDGPLGRFLKEKSPINVKFIPYMPNEELPKEMIKHDVLVLPSISETWGLVVEEALCYGLPVLVSDLCGCAIDLVCGYRTGILFCSGSLDSIKDSIAEIADPKTYRTLKTNVAAFSLTNKDIRQIAEYARAVNL